MEKQAIGYTVVFALILYFEDAEFFYFSFAAIHLCIATYTRTNLLQLFDVRIFFFDGLFILLDELLFLLLKLTFQFFDLLLFLKGYFLDLSCVCLSH